MDADVAVIGLGAMGSATLYQLARRGVSAIGIDRHAPPHTLGSTHGETRITRVGVGEGAAYVPLVQASHRIWDELEQATGAALRTRCGVVVIGGAGAAGALHGRADFVGTSAAVARGAGIGHERLTGAALRRRFPQFIGVRDDDDAYFEPDAGYVRPEACVVAQLDQARALGATLLTGTTVLSVAQAGGRVHVATAGRSLTVGRVIVAAGAWAGPLLGAPFDGLLRVCRQVQHWFALSPDVPETEGDWPAFIWVHGDSDAGSFYGFPPLPGVRRIKTATEQYDAASDAEAVARAVAPAEAAAFHADHLRGRLAGVEPLAVASSVCLYTVTPDHHFLIDAHPRMDRVLVVSPCSGHGFKHSAGIGLAVAAQAAGAAVPFDLRPFALSRFAG